MGVCYDLYNPRTNTTFWLGKGLWFADIPETFSEDDARVWSASSIGERAGETNIDALASALVAFVGDDWGACTVEPDSHDAPWMTRPVEQWPRRAGDRHAFWVLT